MVLGNNKVGEGFKNKKKKKKKRRDSFSFLVFELW